MGGLVEAAAIGYSHIAVITRNGAGLSDQPA